MAYFEEQRLWLLARQGFTPFRVDAGIYCGGYQGPVYPNPTTLTFPAIGFDPLQYRQAIATEYSGTPYTGLGVGNPGIDYRNPGHLLGIIDTFGRMSYGINVLLKTRTDENAGNIPPIIDFSVPMLTYDLDSAPITLSSMYPLFSEIPSQYVDQMGINTSIGRVTSVFYQTSFNPADKTAFDALFTNKSTFSYVNLPQYFRDLIASLYDRASPLSGKTTVNFSEVKNAKNFSPWMEDTSVDGELRVTGSQILETGEFVHKCEVISPTQALKMLTNEVNYHDGPLPNQNDFRSITELNSVINLIPVQTTAVQYVLKTTNAYQSNGDFIVDENYESPQTFGVYSVMVSDILLNIFNKQRSIVRVNGQLIIDFPITRINAEDNVYNIAGKRRLFGGLGGFGPIVDIDINPEENYSALAWIQTSITNNYGWDKSWFGLSSFDNSDFITLPFSLGETEVPKLYEPGTEITPNQTYTINETFFLGTGYNSVRMRIQARNTQVLGTDPGPVHEDLWIDEDSGNPGVIENHWVSTSPRFRKPNIRLSYGVTSDNFSSISHEMEI
jgi:hypothetical protein